MWIGGVNLPAAVVEALRDDRLVLFVGAGASRDKPADLPLFGRLVELIAADAKLTLPEGALDQPDVALGDLEDHGVDVHTRIVAHLDVQGSTPNATHEAVAALAAAAPRPRIVTTNYDRHLSTAMKAAGVHAHEYLAPALPMGDDFDGLVYLHGAVSQPPSQLIATDTDFGRAYLRDAWASRFLERMYATYTVLFIGYSHGDVVMSYLGRALGSRSNRYALTDLPDGNQWRRLKVTPIPYELRGTSHDALPESLGGWAQSERRGMLEHEQRLAELLLNSPPLIPEDLSYLEETLSDVARTRLFVKLAAGEEWLYWVANQPCFAELIDPSAPSTDVGALLAAWIGQQFLTAEPSSEAALALVRHRGGKIGAALAWEVGRAAAFQNPRPSWLDPWIVLLIDAAPTMNVELLEYVLHASTWPDHRSIALLLFDHLTEPIASVGHGLGGERFAIAHRGSEHWLTETYSKIFLPNMVDAAPALAAIADRHLRRRAYLLDAASPTA